MFRQFSSRALAVDLPDHVTNAAIYKDGAIVGVLSRPYQTRAFQNAVPHGARWRVANRHGEIVLVSAYRPSRVAIARALGL